MKRLANFPASRAVLLGDEGATTFSGRSLDKVPPNSWIILARSLCRFSLFEAPTGLSGSRADRAARIWAETTGPYADADYLLIRGPAGYGVWWWDRARVREMLAGAEYSPARIAPESLLYPATEGWRLLRLSDGFEAQCWRDMTLTASVWRRREFTPEQWTAFANTAPGAREVDISAPPATELRADLGLLAAAPRVKPPRGWQDIQQASLVVAAGAMICAAAMAGMTVRYELAARDVEGQRIALEAATAGSPQSYRGDLETLRALVVEEPNPVLVSARVLQALQPFGVAAASVAVEDRKLRLEINNSTSAPAERVAAALESDDWIYNVAAQLDAGSQRIVFTADVCSSTRREVCLQQASTGAGSFAPPSNDEFAANAGTPP